MQCTKDAAVTDDLLSLLRDETNLIAKYSTGFMFDDSFGDSKRYNRFLEKTEKELVGWLNDIGITGTKLSFIMFKMLHISMSLYDDKADDELKDIRKIYGNWMNFVHTPKLVRFTIDEICELDLLNKDSYSEFQQSYALFFDIFLHAWYQFGIQWINEMVIKNQKITAENFVLLAGPSTDYEKFQYVKRVFETIVSDIMMTSAVQQNKGFKTQKDYAKLKSAYKGVNKQLSSLRSDNSGLKKKNEELSAEITRLRKEQKTTPPPKKTSEMEAAFRKEIAGLKKTIRQKDDKLADITEKYEALKEQYQILEAEAEYEREEEPQTYEFSQMSRLLFVCDRAYCGGIQNVYDRILKAFPNSNMIHDVPATADMYDGIVMLTRYMSKHSFYWNTRDFCKNHDIPCRHCDKQGVDLVIADVIERKRFKAVSG